MELVSGSPAQCWIQNDRGLSTNALDTEIATASRNVVASPELLGRIPLCPSCQVQVQGKYIQLVEPQPRGKGVRRSKYLPFVLLCRKKGPSSHQVSQAGLLLASTLLCANEENACLQLTKLERVFPFSSAYKPPSGLGDRAHLDFSLTCPLCWEPVCRAPATQLYAVTLLIRGIALKNNS